MYRLQCTEEEEEEETEDQIILSYFSLKCIISIMEWFFFSSYN